MDEENERYKLLLELAFHTYEEEERRNQLIDSKNKSFVAFLGVMFTIQATIASNFNSMFDGISHVKIDFLLLMFILSLACYFISLIFFSSTLMFTKKFNSAPYICRLIELKELGKDYGKIIDDTIDGLKKSFKINHDIMDDKTEKGNFGFIFVNLGVLFTIIFIFYYLVSIFWCSYV